MEKPRRLYHVVKDDLRGALASIGAKLVHLEDGTDIGKPCFGDVVGYLLASSRAWHEPLHENERAIEILCGPLNQILPWREGGLVVQAEVKIKRESAVEMLRQIDAARNCVPLEAVKEDVAGLHGQIRRLRDAVHRALGIAGSAGLHRTGPDTAAPNDLPAARTEEVCAILAKALNDTNPYMEKP